MLCFSFLFLFAFFYARMRVSCYKQPAKCARLIVDEYNLNVIIDCVSLTARVNANVPQIIPAIAVMTSKTDKSQLTLHFCLSECYSSTGGKRLRIRKKLKKCEN